MVPRPQFAPRAGRGAAAAPPPQLPRERAASGGRDFYESRVERGPGGAVAAPRPPRGLMRPFPLAPFAPARVDDLVHDDDPDAEDDDDRDRFPESHGLLLADRRVGRRDRRPLRRPRRLAQYEGRP